VTTEIDILQYRFELTSINHLLAEMRYIPVFKETLEYTKAITDIELSKLMKNWMLKCPVTFETFLSECSQNKEVSTTASMGLIRDLDFWGDQEIFNDQQRISDLIDIIFINSFDSLVLPVRDWVAERPGVQVALSLKPGIDFKPFGIYPEQKPSIALRADEIPSIETVEGVQTCLIRYSYLDEITGLWDEKTTRAIFRLQLDYEHPKPNGELDNITLELLARDG
jgi:hypothetical protein